MFVLLSYKTVFLFFVIIIVILHGGGLVRSILTGADECLK